jgi:TonB family protein
MDLEAKCIFCARADYPQAAKARKQQGVVLLIVLVREDGIARAIDLVKGEQYRLPQKAIETLQKWRFQPSHDQSGKPRAVWQVIEPGFYLHTGSESSVLF